MMNCRVTPDMVATFCIESHREENNPSCKHRCTISLNDGEIAPRVVLDHDKITSILQVIPKDKVVNSSEANHFVYSKSSDTEVEDILSEVFANALNTSRVRKAAYQHFREKRCLNLVEHVLSEIQDNPEYLESWNQNREGAIDIECVMGFFNHYYKKAPSPLLA